MPDAEKMGGTHITLAGDWSRPATVLIEKCSEAIGGLFKPRQIRRVARAQADADKIQAVTSIEISDLQRRAMQRFFDEEATRQNNMEEITRKALPDVSPDAQPERMEDDWITNFFDKCRLISDEQMQTLWSKILAGEANAPGKFSKRTVNLLGSLDKSDATLFSQLCCFVFLIGFPTVLIFDLNHKIYNDAGITFDAVSHLESAGLIHLDTLGGYARRNLGEKGFVYYFSTPVWIEFPPERKAPREISVGHVLFTKAGSELAPLSGAQPRDGFIDYVKQNWKKFGINTEEPPKPNANDAKT